MANGFLSALGRITVEKPRLLQRDHVIWVVLALLTFAVYWQTAEFDFISMDDYLYVADNQFVRSGLTRQGIQWALTTTHAANWHPLTWLSLMLDTDLSGYSSDTAAAAGPPDAQVYHIVNVLLHALNAVLLFAALSQLTRARWQSAFVAALFALHPLHVESVAWVSERKDVLSTLFWMLAMLAYVRYVRGRDGDRPLRDWCVRGRGGHRPLRDWCVRGQGGDRPLRKWYVWGRDGDRPLRGAFGAYALMIVLYALGLMAKPMLVTLPVVLMLLDWWPLGRYAGHFPSPQPSPARGEEEVSPSPRPLPARVEGEGRGRSDQPSPSGKESGSVFPLLSDSQTLGLSALREKLPLFALAAASCVVTFWAQNAGGSVQSLDTRPFGVRAANAVVSAASYLVKTLYPAGLGVYYPHRGTSIPVWQVVLSALALAGITLLVVRFRRRQPWLAVGWLWYLITLLPVVGLVQVGDQAMADRYTYVPLTGIFIAVAFALPELLKGSRARLTLQVASVAAIVALAVCSYIQVGYWRNGITLFERTIAVTSPRNAVALFNLGVAYERQGYDEEKAAELYRAALRVEPKYLEAYYNLGNILTALDRHAEAWEAYNNALKLNPGSSQIHAAVGYLLTKEGKIDEAIAAFKEAVRINPDNVDARYNLDLLEEMKQRSRTIDSQSE